MDWLTTFYIILVLAGIVWIAYRFWRQVQTEREEMSDRHRQLSDEQFKAYLDQLISRNPHK